MTALGRIAAIAALSLAVATPLIAQEDLQRSGILLLDQDRLYAESRFGQKSRGEIDAQVKALQAENRRLEADLEAEEKALTSRRATLAATEFRRLADAFDMKVKGIRTARDAKAADLAAQRDAARKSFFKATVPILAAIMREKEALAIIDRSAVVLSFDRIDITDLAIARVDAVLAPDAAPPPPPAGQPDQPGSAAPADTPPAPAASPVGDQAGQ